MERPFRWSRKSLERLSLNIANFKAKLFKKNLINFGKPCNDYWLAVILGDENKNPYTREFELFSTVNCKDDIRIKDNSWKGADLKEELKKIVYRYFGIIPGKGPNAMTEVIAYLSKKMAEMNEKSPRGVEYSWQFLAVDLKIKEKSWSGESAYDVV